MMYITIVTWHSCSSQKAYIVLFRRTVPGPSLSRQLAVIGCECLTFDGLLMRKVDIIGRRGVEDNRSVCVHRMLKVSFNWTETKSRRIIN